jgi:hypothetical protein
MKPIYTALYPEHGGPAKGFLCGSCPDVTRTRIGMLRHLWRKHRIKVQLKIDLDAVTEEQLVELDK